MEKTPVRASLDFVDDIGLEVDVERPGHVFARRRLGEEGAEAMIGVSLFTLLGQVSIRLDC